MERRPLNPPLTVTKLSRRRVAPPPPPRVAVRLPITYVRRQAPSPPQPESMIRREPIWRDESFDKTRSVTIADVTKRLDKTTRTVRGWLWLDGPGNRAKLRSTKTRRGNANRFYILETDLIDWLHGLLPDLCRLWLAKREIEAHEARVSNRRISMPRR